jgi:hypothetical protein
VKAEKAKTDKVAAPLIDDDRSGWTLVDHCCRFCLGRVAQKDVRFRCTGCGSSSTEKPDPICGCGLRVNGKRHHRCLVNDHRSPSYPAEIVIHFDGQPVERPPS